MRRERFGSLDALVAGGLDGDGSGAGPLVILLHGFGAPGDDLAVFSKVLAAPDGTRFVFPEAPLELEGGYGEARAWWMIDLERLDRDLQRGVHSDRSQELPANLPAMRHAIVELISASQAALGAKDSPLILGGFSQGAMLACDVALHSAVPPDGVVLLSGTLIAQSEWEPRLEALRGLRVFQSHGDDDPLLPFAAAERLRSLLESGGATVQWHPFEGGHEIPPEVCSALSDWMRGTCSWVPSNGDR